MNRKYIIGILIIAGVTVGVYFPSVFHLFRGESYSYFVDAQGYTFMTEEPMLFRPLLSGMFNLQLLAFGMNPMLWHISALFMHFVACFALYRLLWAIKPSVIALLVTLFFSTMYLTVNAVLYTVISPYSLVIAIVLSALYWLYEGVKQNKQKYIYLAFASMLVGCLFYEVIIFFTVLMGLYIWLERKHLTFSWKRAEIPCLFLVVLYVSVYLTHLLINSDASSAQFNSVFSIQSITFGLSKIPIIIATWLSQIALPSAFIVIPTDKLQYQSAGFGMSGSGLINAMSVIALFLIGYFVYQRRKNNNSHFMLLLGLMGLGYVVIISVFRAYTIGIDYILATNIDANMFLGLAIVLMYAWLSPKRLTPKPLLVVSLSLLLIIGVSASKTFTVNNDIRITEQSSKEYLEQVDRFIEKYKDEPNFSIKSVANSDIEKMVNIRLYGVDKLGKQYPYDLTVPQIMHFEYWSDNPKYYLEYQGSVLIVQKMK